MARKPQRKKRTSIRTAAATAQKAYLERLRALRDDPLRVLPECPHGEPKAIARVRVGLERIAAGKTGFLLRRDKGVVGAVAQALPLADQESFPRLIDHKVGGARRFFLQRGHVARLCSLGVQNHDDPRTLLMAYRGLAKSEGLHFFAGPTLVCTGTTPDPPESWVEALSERTSVPFQQESGVRGWGCGHTGTARVRLGFHGGPDLRVCGACGQRAGNVHQAVRTMYAGPRERQPLEVDVLLSDGSHDDPVPDQLAAYRGGIQTERGLIGPIVLRWRERLGSGAVRFVLGDQDFGGGQDAFLDALGTPDWMRGALAAMTRDGHVGRRDALGGVLEAHAAQVAAGVDALLGDGAAFVAANPGLSAMALLQRAHEEAQGRARVADLPTLTGLGPVGSRVDDWARTVRRDGKGAGIDWVRRSHDHLHDAHRYALLLALGGDLGLDRAFDADAKEAGRRRAPAAEALLGASGDAYRESLATYLRDAGTGETVG